MTKQVKISSAGRVWERQDGGSRAHIELWRATDADQMAHGWAVCFPGDEPDHSTWSTTTKEELARDWYDE